MRGFIFSAIFFIILHHSESSYLPKRCIRVPGKCDGKMKFDHVAVDPSIQPVWKETLSPKECQEKCTVEASCLMAKHNSVDYTCSFYNISSFSHEAIYKHELLFYWQCCVTEEMCFDSSGRCPGYWAQELNTYYSFKANPMAILENISDAEYCEKACLTNSLCDTAMYSQEKQLCHLRRKWFTGSAPKRKFNLGWSSITWSCCSDFVKPSIDASCRFQQAKISDCRGSWSLSNYLTQAPKLEYITDLFPTFSYQKCWESCENHLDCIHPYFNQTHSICVLEGSKQIVRGEVSLMVPPGMTFQFWNWECCYPIEHKSLSPVDYGDCLCLVNSSQIEAATYTCNKSDTMPKYHKKLIDNMAFFDKGIERINDGQIWRLVSNGYRYLWLREKSAGAIIPCSSEECAYYSGEFNDVEKPKLVSRQNWYAMIPKDKNHFRNLPKYVVILNTYKPSDPCKTEQDCLYKLHWIQKYHMIDLGWSDVAYNFMIGENGRIYVGRGWDHTGAHTYGYNFKSIGIAFIGWFEHRRPSLEALQAAKDLIAYGAKHSKIDPHYVLIAHRDVSDSKEIPGIQLYNLLTNWFHFHDDKHQDIPFLTNCTISENETKIIPPPKKAYIVPSVIGCLIVIIILIAILAGIYYIKSRHTKFCCFVSQHSVTDKTFLVPIFGWVPNTSQLQIKDSGMTNINHNNSKVFVVGDAFQSCSCSTLISRLMEYSAYMSHHACLELIKSSYFIRECKLPTGAVVMPGADIFSPSEILIFHVDNIDFINDTITNLGQKRCFCKSSSVSLQEVDPFDDDLPVLPRANIVSLISKTNEGELLKLKSNLERVRKCQVEVKFAAM